MLDDNAIWYGESKKDCSRHLDPFASGLVTVIIDNEQTIRRDSIQADYKYRLIVELGAERQYHCIDDEILSVYDIDHLPFKLIKQAVKSLAGNMNNR